jgi:hypothetical protein
MGQITEPMMERRLVIVENFEESGTNDETIYVTPPSHREKVRSQDDDNVKCI